MVPEFFRLEELEPCKKNVAEQVEALAQKLYKAGKIQGIVRAGSVPSILYNMMFM